MATKLSSKPAVTSWAAADQMHVLAVGNLDKRMTLEDLFTEIVVAPVIKNSNGIDIDTTDGSDADVDLLTCLVTGNPKISWDNSKNSLVLGGNVYSTGAIVTQDDAPIRRQGILAGVADIKHGTAARYSILCIGDSWTAGKTWTTTLRKTIQQRLGHGGPGYCPLDVVNDAPAGVTRSTTGTWTDAASTYSPSTGATSSTDVATPAEKSIAATADTFVVYYRGGGGTFKWKLDSGAWTEVDTSAQSGNQYLTIDAVTSAAHTIYLQPVSGAAVSLFGVDCQDTNRAGLRVSEWAKNGVAASDFAALDATAFAANLTALAPRCVLIMLGVNDMSSDRTPAQYEADLTTIVTRVKAACATADVIIVPQGDSGYSGTTYAQTEYIAKMRAVAAEQDALFIDLWTALGAYNSNALGLWLTLHPSAVGGRTIAEILTDVLCGPLENTHLRGNLSVLANANPESMNSGNTYTGLYIYDLSTKGISNITVRGGANQTTSPLLKLTSQDETSGLAYQLTAGPTVYMVAFGADMSLGAPSGQVFNLISNGSVNVSLVAAGDALNLASSCALTWSQYTSPAYWRDTSISRTAAATLAIGNGTVGDTTGTLICAAHKTVGNIGAAAGTGVAAVEYGTQVVHQTVLTFTNHSVTINDPTGAAGYGTTKCYDFPEGQITILSAVANLTLTAGAGGISDTFNGDFALGTAGTADSDFGDAGEATIIASTATPAATSGASTAKGQNTAAVVIDGTGTAADLYLNFLVDDGDISAADTLAVGGTLTITWIKGGDY